MKINDAMMITKRLSDDALYGVYNGLPFCIEVANPDYSTYNTFYNTMRATPYGNRAALCEELKSYKSYDVIFKVDGTPCETPKNIPEEKVPEEKEIVNTKQQLLIGITKLMDFFSEFGFTPSLRFANTFSFKTIEGINSARSYVNNYFDLMDSAYKNEVMEKTKSAEFTNIIKMIAQYGSPNNVINKRLKIYYGPAGTGKTTTAQLESENRCIVCNSSMLPSDLMEDFIFKDGNPDFNPSLLWDCMEQGKTIVLDEINLLPFDSLRFLQGIADGKTEFYYKNRPVHIHEGFQIIGTMNLDIGGVVYGLPEPLVDRCADTKKFTLTAAQLATAILREEDGDK